MGRSPFCNKNELKKGPWTQEEDQMLIMDYIQKHGHESWRSLPKNAGLARCGKSCRLRWMNYLRPDIKRGRFSFEEEETIIQLHRLLGNKWSAIAARLPGRTDTEIKNYWNTHIRKRLLRMGIDPVTHGPSMGVPEISSIFNIPSLCNPTQLLVSRILGFQPAVVHSNLLAIVTNLLSSQHQYSNIGLQSIQDLPCLQSPQIQDSIPNFQNIQFVNSSQDITTASVTQSATNMFQNSWMHGDLATGLGLECMINQNYDDPMVNNQSLLTSITSNMGMNQQTELNLSSACINGKKEDRSGSDSIELFDDQIRELLDVRELLEVSDFT